MMQAKVTTPFPGCEDGEFHPREISAGETITGELAAAAVAAGLAEEIAPDGKKGGKASSGEGV